MVNRLNSLGVGLKYKFVRDSDPACLQQGRAAHGRQTRPREPKGARDLDAVVAHA